MQIKRSLVNLSTARKINYASFIGTDRKMNFIDTVSRPSLSLGITQLSQVVSAEIYMKDWEKLTEYLKQCCVRDESDESSSYHPFIIKN